MDDVIMTGNKIFTKVCNLEQVDIQKDINMVSSKIKRLQILSHLNALFMNVIINVELYNEKIKENVILHNNELKEITRILSLPLDKWREYQINKIV